MDRRPLPKITPLMTAAAVIIAQSLILAVAFGLSPDMDPARVWLVPAVAVLTGCLTAFFHARRWYVLLAVYVVGLIVGDASALSIAHQPVENAFFVSAATVAFFVIISLALGLVAELVRFIHYLVHGGRARQYPADGSAKKK